MPRDDRRSAPPPDADKAAEVSASDIEAAKVEARRAAPPRLKWILNARSKNT